MDRKIVHKMYSRPYRCGYVAQLNSIARCVHAHRRIRSVRHLNTAIFQYNGKFLHTHAKETNGAAAVSVGISEEKSVWRFFSFIFRLCVEFAGASFEKEKVSRGGDVEREKKIIQKLLKNIRCSLEIQSKTNKRKKEN